MADVSTRQCGIQTKLRWNRPLQCYWVSLLLWNHLHQALHLLWKYDLVCSQVLFQGSWIGRSQCYRQANAMGCVLISLCDCRDFMHSRISEEGYLNLQKRRRWPEKWGTASFLLTTEANLDSTSCPSSAMLSLPYTTRRIKFEEYLQHHYRPHAYPIPSAVSVCIHYLLYPMILQICDDQVALIWLKGSQNVIFTLSSVASWICTVASMRLCHGSF